MHTLEGVAEQTASRQPDGKVWVRPNTHLPLIVCKNRSINRVSYWLLDINSESPLTAQSTIDGSRVSLDFQFVITVNLRADEGIGLTERVEGRAVTARWSSSVGMLVVEHVLGVLRVASSIDADQEVQGTIIVTLTIEPFEGPFKSRALGNGTTNFTRF